MTFALSLFLTGLASAQDPKPIPPDEDVGGTAVGSSDSDQVGACSTILNSADSTGDGTGGAGATTTDKCDRTKFICFATMTENMCTTAGGKLEGGICKIDKGAYTFVSYLKAWISAYLLKIGLAISLILIMTAGVLYMFSGTDPGKATLAKDLIITTLSGLIFLFLAETIFGWIVR